MYTGQTSHKIKIRINENHHSRWQYKPDKTACVEHTKLVNWILLKNQYPGQQIQMHGPANKKSNRDEAASQNKTEG